MCPVARWPKSASHGGVRSGCWLGKDGVHRREVAEVSEPSSSSLSGAPGRGVHRREVAEVNEPVVSCRSTRGLSPALRLRCSRAVVEASGPVVLPLVESINLRPAETFVQQVALWSRPVGLLSLLLGRDSPECVRPGLWPGGRCRLPPCGERGSPQRGRGRVSGSGADACTACFAFGSGR